MRRIRAAVLAAALLLAGTAGCTAHRNSTAKTEGSTAHAVTKPSSGTSATATPGQLTAGRTSRAAAPATTRGPWGVTASWVQQENRRPGTNSWKIAKGAGRGIEGYAGTTYAAVGDHVALYVSTAASSFRVRAYRMGWYQGLGARLVWTSGAVRGAPQPACGLAAATNTVSCQSWAPSTTLTVTDRFPPGDYLLELVGAGGQESYVPLTIWDPASHATYLIKNDVMTWQGWNAYGGYDFYRGRGNCPAGVYPLCSRARIVSFDRPYAGGGGAFYFKLYELPLVQFAERHGLDVGYVTDITVVEHPSVVAGHDALLSLGHDESWALPEREAVLHAYQHGLNLMFLGASAVLRHVRLASSPHGPDRLVVDYRDSAQDPLNGHGDPRQVTGNTWSDPPASWPENQFVGEAYAGFVTDKLPAKPLVVVDPSSFVFQGLTVRQGTVVPGVLVGDVDGFDPGDHPAGLDVLAHSPISRADGQSPFNYNGTFYSDMTYYTNRTSGAGVFDSGTNNWIPAMGACPASERSCPQQFTTTVMGNVFRAFGDGPAGRHHPSRANWSGVPPY